MIDTPFGYVTVLLAIASSLYCLETYVKLRLFRYLPAIVLLYFVVMVCASMGVWESGPVIDNTYKALRNNLLPAMIFLMLLNADLRQIKKLGWKMILTFLLASMSIACGFILTFALFHNGLADNAWKTFAALCGSWMGGTGNLAAVQLALDVPDSAMGYTLLIDSIDYALWVMLLLALVPFARQFNRWTGADDRMLADVGASLEQSQQQSYPVSGGNLLLMLALSCGVSAWAQWLSGFMPSSAYFTGTAWTVAYVTLAGVIGAMSPLKRFASAEMLAMVMLNLIIALIASRASFGEMLEAPVYILAGGMILLIHGLVMVLCAKLFKLDLFTCGLASLANIGGVASAPILAASYSKALIPVGVLMAMLGYIVGTAGGLAVGRVLALITH
ncbi:DUF819 family protein [Alteromonas sp. C1M14]|uniref:DUF819 family protein n=1 Tax=Alteromonas sp. C1M14 TaxID=2841567 RepID=UPI001C0A6314|nr:DUF819 family protein [Alteromonas sp. C1M14]MBU2978720.1 DUF819 family protein [Alteromonas sp. C1M14]